MKPLSRCSFLAVVLSAIFAAPALGARHFPGPPQTPPAPTAAFTYTPASPRAGQPVAFNGTGSTCPDQPCSYVWSDDGGPVAPESVLWPLGAGETLSFTFSEPKTKYVRLTVTDALGRSSSVEHNVVVTAREQQPPSEPPPSEPPPSEPPPSEPPPSEPPPSEPPPSEPPPSEPPPSEPPATGSVTCNETVSSASAVASALSSVGAGRAVCLSAGTYSTLTLDNINPAGNVTLEPAQGASVTIAGINIVLDSNLTIRGFHFSRGVYVQEGASSLTFEENVTSNTECGYFFYGWEGHEVSHMQVLDNTMEYLNFTGSEAACSGAGVVMLGNAKNFTVDNNQIGPHIASHYTQAPGIKGLQENGNTFLGPANRREHGEEDHTNILQIFGGGENIEFDNNVMEHTETNGGSLLFQSGQMRNVQVDNNLFDEDAEGYSVQIYPEEGVEFAHNTVVNSHWGVYFRAAESGGNNETRGDDYTVDYNVMVGNTGTTPDITELGCSSSCAWNHNITSDGSANGEGSIDHWVPLWLTGSLFEALGLPFEAGYRAP